MNQAKQEIPEDNIYQGFCNDACMDGPVTTSSVLPQRRTLQEIQQGIKGLQSEPNETSNEEKDDYQLGLEEFYPTPK